MNSANSNSNPKTGSAFPPSLLLLVVGGVALLAWLLLPRSSTLIERQIQDGSFHRAADTLRQTSAAERAKNPAFYASVELQVERALTPKHDTRRWMAWIGKAAQTCATFPAESTALKELLAAIAAGPPFQLFYQQLSNSLPGLSFLAQSQIHNALARRALADNHPLDGAKMFDDFWRRFSSDPAATRQAIRLWRSAGQSENALRCLDAHLALTPGAKAPDRGIGADASKSEPSLPRLRIDLLRETGQALAAFEFTLELHQAALETARDELTPLLLALAQEASQVPRILGVAHDWARVSPSQMDRWQLLARLAIAAPDLPLAGIALKRARMLEPNQPAHLLQLAQVHEWSGKPGEAFDYYAKALEFGSDAAMNPLLRLNAGLYRDEDLLAAVSKIQNRALVNLFATEIARVHVKAAEFDRAAALYQSSLSQHPDDLGLLLEYGRLCLDLHQFDKADAILVRAEKLRPRDLQVRAALAETKFRQQDFPAALERFWEIARESGDPAASQHFVTLAVSLGEFDRAVQALQRRIEEGQEVTPRDYEQLAYLASVTGQTNRHHQTLLTGVERFPEHQPLRVQAAYTFSDRGDFIEAAKLIQTLPQLGADIELSRFYLSMLVQSHKYAEAAAFLEQRLSAKLQAEPVMLELSAQIHDATGKHAAAAVLYQKLTLFQPANTRFKLSHARALVASGQWKQARPLLQDLAQNPSADVDPALATVFAAAGKHREATAYQRRYIESGPADPSAAWSFLGDLLLAQGDPAAARRAYRRALDEKLEAINAKAAP